VVKLVTEPTPPSPEPIAAPQTQIAAPTTSAPEVEIRPAAVAAQIAHHAELYRVPGGRGVRIELRPEGLGGVEVTIRYGAGGTLELHMAVDRAATGSLVQAGWGELRHALALQGIAPERLVMSVSQRADAGLSDSSNGGFRSDQRQPDFGQSGRERRESDEARRHGRLRAPEAVDNLGLHLGRDANARLDLRV
jgi:flagellar hook-length control protein FliK